ncbi:RHS repeat-associated core domain-containing protein [bacterium]|nr:RHS repeat-associated core domain-containing protein [bacterium]
MTESDVGGVGPAAVTEYEYDPAGNLEETRFANGVVEYRQYDALNRLTEVRSVRLADGQELNRFTYTLNPAGHRESVTESWLDSNGVEQERTVNYRYDDLDRLVQEEIAGGETTKYAYDAVGNRESVTVVSSGVTRTYEYDANNRLVSESIAGVEQVAYEYDLNGNLTAVTGGGVTLGYVWDDRNRLVQVLEDGVELVSYAYDDDNIRVSATVGGVTTSYLLDKNRPYAQVLEEYEDGSSTVSYAYGLDLIEQERDGVESYYLIDGLGSTRGLTGAGGEVTDTYTYDAYGNLVDAGGSSENAYLFAGEQWDEHLEQYYLRQRYYDPTLGRFTRRDTWEGNHSNPITLNKHIYANADPANFVDPSGLAALGELALSNKWGATLAAMSFGLAVGNSHKMVEFDDPPSPFPHPLSRREPTYPSTETFPGGGSLIGKLLRLPGFGEGARLEYPQLEGFPTTHDDLVRYFFTISGSNPAREYRPTEKHMPGGWGTVMDLDDTTAQQILINGLTNGKQVYNYYNGKLYEFQPDNIGGFHGYPVPGTEVPPNILREFRDNGTISNSQYNKFRKGK